MLERVTSLGGTLLVPLALWGRSPPTHSISCIQVINHEKYTWVITGSSDGQIIIWIMDKPASFETLRAQYMLFGHSSEITALCPASEDEKTEVQFISADKSGKLCLWNCTDGRCMESVQTSQIHCHMRSHAYPSSKGISSTIVCIGQYPEIVLLSPKNLSTQHTLCSRVEPDWIAALTIIKPPKRSHIAIGVSNCGMIKIWSLTDLETRDKSRPIFEDESKQIGTRNTVLVEACPDNPRCMLVVCNSSWQIFDASDFCPLAGQEASSPNYWIGGKFFAVDKVAAWCSDGNVLLYQLPRSKLRGKAIRELYGDGASLLPSMDSPSCFCVLKPTTADLPLVHAPVFCLLRSDSPTVIRGDCTGKLTVWNVPSVNDKSLAMLLQDKSFSKPEELSKLCISMETCWDNCSAVGIADNLVNTEDTISATVHVASQGRLILGRKDGSILLVSATQAIAKQLLDMSSLNKAADWPNVRVLIGHEGSVTCLLYPHEDHPRYEANHLLSGGIDFSIFLWDLSSGTKLHKFCVQAGPILKLIIPPENCNRRILDCVCSVASDHSVALFSLKEMKCLLLASRHIYPIMDIKWRPLDDFLLVQCEDMSLYVWQMETGHLDRIITGLLAEEILQACEDQLGVEEGEDQAGANTAVQMLRAIKHKNVAVMKQIAGSGMIGSEDEGQMVELSPPLLVEGLRTNCDDGDSHLVFFNVEALILGLLAEENAVDLRANQSSNSSVVSEKPADSFADLLALAKTKAENVLKTSPTPQRRESQQAKKQQVSFAAEGSVYIESAQLLLSLLHAWDLDKDLDKVCAGKLGLICPRVPLCFGGLSRHGNLTLLLPSGVERKGEDMKHFNREVKWSLSMTLTTQHLLSIISCANTLMSMVIAGFLPQHEKRRRLVKRMSQMKMSASSAMPGGDSDTSVVEHSQVKQGWSLLAAMHCVLLPELVDKDSSTYKPPRIDLLARRWQERCFELREATQALLVRELTRLGSCGRKPLVEQWSKHLPMFVEPSLSIFCPPPAESADEAMNDANGFSCSLLSQIGDSALSVTTSVQQARRDQATAIVLLGVIGSQFAYEISNSNQTDQLAGFGAGDDSLAMATSQALMELLVSPASVLLPPFSPLRRAAIDLLGKGFCVWQPYLDISKVLLGLLEISAASDKLLPSGKILFPLSPQADACRTAKQAITQIASVRPPAFITALSKEVARYHAQTQHAGLQHGISPLIKARAEILKIIEVLSDKQYNDLVELMIPVGEVLVHCLDTSLLKQRTLHEIFPPITKFYMVSYCANTRRIAFGGKNGSVVIHELRAAKSQTVQAHSRPVTSCAFSEDGKHLATYSADESKINFWQVVI